MLTVSTAPRGNRQALPVTKKDPDSLRDVVAQVKLRNQDSVSQGTPGTNTLLILNWSEGRLL